MREVTRVCKYGACAFLLRKNGCGDSLRSRRGFLPWPSVRVFPRPADSPTVTARDTTEYCFIDTAR